MDISPSSLTPRTPATPERRDGSGRKTDYEQVSQPPRGGEAHQPPRPGGTGPDYQQTIRHTRVEQARHDNPDALRLDSHPYPQQQALRAYEAQQNEGRRFWGGVELMPRVDAYV